MTIYDSRLKLVKEKMREKELAGMILFPSPNMNYMTQFHTFPGERLLITVVPVNDEPFFIAPKLFESQIRKDSWIQDMVLWSDEENAYHVFQQVMRDRGLEKGTYAVDETMWADQLLGMMNVLVDSQFVPMGDLLNSLRLIKSGDEIAKIRKASQLVDDVLRTIQGQIRPNMTEIELAALMEFEMRKGGSTGPSFETIVGSGPNSAIPHYNAGERKIQAGEFIVLDFGATYQGYCSDTTRTLCVGEPTEKMREVYEVVREAQEIGFQTVKPGIKAHEVDDAVRKHITERGYGEYFTHRTGHGLGMQVHEEPYISAISDMILEPGMIFSIEPGIYINGQFGVRIEDIVVVTEEGCERLNNFPHELTRINF